MSSRTLLQYLRRSHNVLVPSLSQSHNAMTPAPLCQRLKCLQHHNPHSRGLLTPSTPPPYRTSAEVVRALSQDIIGGPSNYDPDLYNKKREELLKILPKSQAELPPRRMLDSYDSAIIPIASDPSLKDHYITYDGGVRVGRLLEDMDIFAVHLGKKKYETQKYSKIFSFQFSSMF